MGYLQNLIVLFLLIILTGLFFLRLRRNLLILWKEVAIKDVIFHKLLLETTILFHECNPDLESIKV